MKTQHRFLAFMTITFVFMAYGITAYAGVSCSDLTLQPYGDATITSATMVPADGDTPAYCKVNGTAGLQTDIEVRLPDNWQKRYLHIGGSGFDGTVPDLNRHNLQLQQGYALAASNGGHRSTNPGYPEVDASFGLDSTLTQDYAYAAIGTTVRMAKALIAAYYGERPQYSYWWGFSNGGRGGYNAAAKYASEFDGIIAGAPTRNWAGAIAGWMQNLRAMNLADSQKAAISTAMVAACDKLDGLEDGVISNPDDCTFDPETVAGLSESEIALVKNILSDITLSDGTIIYSRYGFGPLAWTLQYYALGVGNVGYIVYRDPAYDPDSWNLNNDYPNVVAVIEGTYDFSADTDALVSYLKSGKKLIVYHGTDDTALSHYDTIRSMDELASAAGSYGQTNMRLYIVPGYGHGGEGRGVNRCDMIPVITDWVEKGIAPKTLLASKVDAQGNVFFTRPLCEYPYYPHYFSGDPNDANSFVCTRPKHGQDMLCPSSLIYGEHSEETELLRHIRDNLLSKTPEGRALIQFYYQWSPTVAMEMEEDEEFKQEVKGIIDTVLTMLKGEEKK